MPRMTPSLSLCHKRLSSKCEAIGALQMSWNRSLKSIMQHLVMINKTAQSKLWISSLTRQQRPVSSMSKFSGTTPILVFHMVMNAINIECKWLTMTISGTRPSSAECQRWSARRPDTSYTFKRESSRNSESGTGALSNCLHATLTLTHCGSWTERRTSWQSLASSTAIPSL